MLFPISDDDREVTSPMYVTYILLAINIGVFLLQLSDPDINYAWSAVPQEITSGQDLVSSVFVTTPDGKDHEIPHQAGPPILWLTLFSSMFMHGGFGHIAGNMLYLWIFGDNVEHRFGHLPFLMFYLLAGLVASLAQILFDPNSVIPIMGASGAIAGVMGAYVVLFPRNKVNAVLFYFIVSIPAVFVLGMWIVMQMVSGYGAIAATEATTGGVAYLAHIGGFVAGVAAAMAWRWLIKEEPDSSLRRQYQRDPQTKRIW